MDERQRLLERLPDYLNGHVAGEDARRIAAFLESEAAWQAQVAVLADVRAAVGARMAAMDDDAGLDELKRRIAAAPGTAADTPPPQAGWWQRLLGMRLGPMLTPAVMATLAGVCVVQGWMLHGAREPEPDSGLAWRNAPFSVAAPQANLQVRFAADASLAQLEAALTAARARIVSGPQGGQRYLLQADDPVAALARRRASAAVVEAGPFAAGPPP